MSEFKDEEFVPEFVYRTQINYYQGLLLELNSKKAKGKNDEEKIFKATKRLNHLKLFSKIKQYDSESNFFEITQLINSLMGLLVFPEQAYFKYINDRCKDFKKIMPTLAKYIYSENKENFFNTYRYTKEKENWEDNPKEKINAKNILRHLRNAVAHEKISIYPVNNGGIITHIKFKDERYSELIYFKDKKYKWQNVDDKKKNKSKNNKIEKEEFFLRISVDDLEEILLEISDALLRDEDKLRTHEI